MNQPEFDGQQPEEKPLDPATLRVQAKLKRLLAGSSLVMLAGFIAVFAAIFYKIKTADNSSGSGEIPSTIALGAGAEVLGMETIDGHLVLLVDQDGSQKLVHVNPNSGAVLGETAFVGR